MNLGAPALENSVEQSPQDAEQPSEDEEIEKAVAEMAVEGAVDTSGEKPAPVEQMSYEPNEGASNGSDDEVAADPELSQVVAEGDDSDPREADRIDDVGKIYDAEREKVTAKDEESKLGSEEFTTGDHDSSGEKGEVSVNQADELEKWAGILEEYPQYAVLLGSALKYKMKPEDMLALEDEAREADKELARLQESDWMDPHTELDLAGAVGVKGDLLEKLMNGADETTRDTLNALVSDCNKIDLELRAKVAQLREEMIIEPLIAEKAKRDESFEKIFVGAHKAESVPTSEPEQSEEPNQEENSD